MGRRAVAVGVVVIALAGAGGAWWAVGRGSGEGCRVGSSAFSVELWVAPAAAQDYARLFEADCAEVQVAVLWHDEAVQVYRATDGEDGPAQAATRSLTLGGFAHLVWSFDGSEHQLWVNGERSRAGPTADDVDPGGGSADPFDGRLRDVTVHDRALDPATIGEHRVAGLAAAPSGTGSLAAALLGWEAGEVPRQRVGYTPPSRAATDDLATAFADVRAGRLDAAAERAAPHRYEVARLTDDRTGRPYVLLRERRRPDGSWAGAWGTFVWSPESTSSLVVESPHTVSDWRLTEVATDLFQRADGRALLVAGAGRWAGGDTGRKSTDPADVANFTGPTVFQAVHERLLDLPGARVAQLHGNDRATEEDLVVSNGDDDPVAMVRDLAEAYERLDLPAGVRLYAEDGGSDDTELTARRNPQGVTARAAGVPWAHIELSRRVREDDALLAAVQDATVGVLG